MGRLLRDQKNVGRVKPPKTQSNFSGNKAIIPKSVQKTRHALSDKTNRSENDSPVQSILSESVAKRNVHTRSSKTSGSDNDSPANRVLARREAKINLHVSSDKIIENLIDSSKKKVICGNRPKRNALAEKINYGVSDSPEKGVISGKKTNIQDCVNPTEDTKETESNSSTKETGMSLRQRKKDTPTAENATCKKLLSESKNASQSEICSPRAPSASNEQKYSCLNLDTVRKSRSRFVKLEDISEILETLSATDNVKQAKKPIYLTGVDEDDLKIDSEMLPEEKIKLYEYEVNANSPKKIAVNRKRKPRKKKVQIVDSDLSEEENCPMRSVVKRLCTLTTSSPSSTKTNAVNKSVTFPVNLNDSKCLTPRILRVVLSPIKTPIHKSDNNLPSANSTPNATVSNKESVPLKALRFSEKEISSPVAKINHGRQIKKSIFINPAEILERNFTPDVSLTSEVNTSRNHTPSLVASPLQSLKQTKINSFFSTSGRSENFVNNDASSHCTSGIFEELPSRINSESSMSTTAASSASQFITMRRKAMYHTKPRISAFERVPEPPKAIKKMTVENCFGFDDDDDTEDNYIPPTVQYRSLPLSVSMRAVCSTPVVARQPSTTGNAQTETRPPPPPRSTVKLASSPLSVLKRLVPVPASVPFVPTASEYNSCSPPLILSDPETLTPVTFGDEPSNFGQPARRSYQRTPRPKRNYAEASSEEDEPLVAAKKPKKKGKQYIKKQKQEVDSWATSLNRQFEEIEDVDLVVE